LNTVQTVRVAVCFPDLKTFLVCQSFKCFVQVLKSAPRLLDGDLFKIDFFGVVLGTKSVISVLDSMCSKATIVLDVEFLVGAPVISVITLCLNQFIRLNRPLQDEQEHGEFEKLLFV